MKYILVLIGIVFLSFLGTAQVSDTLIIDSLPPHSPRTATLLSLAVPGLGQAYNKKYWKIPVVYALIATPLYFGLENQREFNDFKKAYAARTDTSAMTVDTKFTGIFTDAQLLQLVDDRRERRDLFFVLTGLAYIINVVDAAVDAHLFYFDVGDDLSARLKPGFMYASPQHFMVPSVTLSLKFAKKNHKKAY